MQVLVRNHIDGTKQDDVLRCVKVKQGVDASLFCWGFFEFVTGLPLTPCIVP